MVLLGCVVVGYTLSGAMKARTPDSGWDAALLAILEVVLGSVDESALPEETPTVSLEVLRINNVRNTKGGREERGRPDVLDRRTKWVKVCLLWCLLRLWYIQ